MDSEQVGKPKPQSEIRKAPEGSNYKGKNFIPNFRKNKAVKNEAKAKIQQNQNQPPVQRPKIQPTLLHLNTNFTPLRNEPILSESIFAKEVYPRETQERIEFSPNGGSFPRVVKDTWQELSKEKGVDQILCAETFSYYCTAMYLHRSMELKEKNGIPLTSEEKKVRSTFKNNTYNIPQPVFLYLRSIGRVTAGTGQHLNATIPDMPTVTVGNMTGTFGRISISTHNLYEEVPCLGVSAALLRAASGDTAPETIIDLDIVPHRATPNSNLLGFFALSHRSEGSKLFLAESRVNPISIGEDIPGTAYNARLVMSISDVLSRLTDVKMQRVQAGMYPESGSTAMLVETVPDYTDVDVNDEEYPPKNSDVRTIPYSLTKENDNILTAAIIFGFNRMKENTLDVSLTVASRAWCCVSWLPQAAQPEEELEEEEEEEPQEAGEAEEPAAQGAPPVVEDPPPIIQDQPPQQPAQVQEPVIIPAPIDVESQEYLDNLEDIPLSWIRNRNDRRDLPSHFRFHVWIGMKREAKTLRNVVIANLFK